MKSSYVFLTLVNQTYCNLTTLELYVSREQVRLAMLNLPCHGVDVQELFLLCGERAPYPCWTFREATLSHFLRVSYP